MKLHLEANGRDTGLAIAVVDCCLLGNKEYTESYVVALSLLIRFSSYAWPGVQFPSLAQLFSLRKQSAFACHAITCSLPAPLRLSSGKGEVTPFITVINNVPKKACPLAFCCEASPDVLGI